MQLLLSKVASALSLEGGKAKYTEVVHAELKQVRLGCNPLFLLPLCLHLMLSNFSSSTIHVNLSLVTEQLLLGITWFLYWVA